MVGESYLSINCLNLNLRKMKKLFITFFTGAILFTSCTKVDIKETFAAETDSDNPLEAPAERRCAADEVLQQELKADPGLRKRMQDIEDFTTRYSKIKVYQRLSGDSMIIPVVVNVLYKTAAENISLAQIESQIAVLNEDFRGNNADITKVPTLFSTVKAGDTRIRFELDQVVRKSTNKKSWSTNNAMKKSSLGGIDPTSPTTNLNMWACNMGGGILGYAQFPGGSASTDGVVILSSAFGSRPKVISSGSSGYFISTYDLGRTATHEVGHWLNLRHIWGDATCGNDQVGDTPLHTSANYNCPAAGIKSTCSGTPVMMTMNYMDYTADACMYMFSAGQKTRMEATYALGGPRATLR